MATKSSAKSRGSKQRGFVDDIVRYDVRLRERNLREGVMTRAELDRHLKGLPDAADRAELIVPGQPPAEEGAEEAPAPEPEAKPARASKAKKAKESKSKKSGKSK